MSRDVKILGVIAIVVIAGAILGANYYQSSVQKEQKPVNVNKTNPIASGELIRPDSPSLGPADAKVTLVEFYDPECEACAAFHPVIKRILTEYEGKIRLVARYLPLHPNSVTAANFTEAAGEQGKYWEAQELLFKKQPEWATKHGAPPDPSAPPINQLFEKYAKELGLDLKKASTAINERRFDAKIERDKSDGQGLGAKKTPTIFVNGRMLTNFGETGLRSLIAEEMAK
jgi:protein-disulfide isomerase